MILDDESRLASDFSPLSAKFIVEWASVFKKPKPLQKGSDLVNWSTLRSGENWMTHRMDTSTESLRLVIQPDDQETRCYLLSIGFQPVQAVPQLLYRNVENYQLAEVFRLVSEQLSEMSLAMSRFVITRSPLQSRELLIDFLQAQPLSTITLSVKHAWFLRVIAKRNLCFKYQPIFNLESGQVIGYECLARALNSQGSYFSGQQLIDAALSTNLGCEFDELARTSCLQAIAQLSRGLATCDSPQTFFINVLPNAIIRDPDSLAQDCQKVLELGLNPQHIVFELTEVEQLLSCPQLLQILTRLREQGFRIAIDDFCSGVSSDHYFMELRPDVIKLDRRLVHGCSRFPVKQILIKSLLRSAHELSIVVLAEGLEERNDISFCRELGIDLGQGFGLARPELTLTQHPLNVVEFRPVFRAC